MALEGNEILYVIPIQPDGQLSAIVEQTTTQDIANLGGGGGGAVASVFGRTGTVIAEFGDYSYSELSGSILPAQLPNGGGNESYATIASNGGTITLSASQAACSHINITGTPTSDIYVVFPSGTTGKWSVSNRTVNHNANYNNQFSYQTAFNVKCQVAGQSSTVNALPGFSRAMWSDGTTMREDGGNCEFTLNFADWAGTSYVTIIDLTTLIQNFLLYCQLVALNLKAQVLDDQMQRLFVTAYFPRGIYGVSCPIVVPSLVNFKMDGTLYRNGTVGTITNFYNGDTTSQALANLIQPTLIIPPRAHAETVNLYCNPDGINLGSGMAVGKNWTAQSVAIGFGGTGYIVGDFLYATCPLISPYQGFNCHVTSVGAGGVITGVTMNSAGAYDLPPLLQKIQYTAANGYGNVFDSNGYYETYTNSTAGTGATLNPTWLPDFQGGQYWGGFGGIISDTILGHININNVGRQNDGTYGPCFAAFFWGLNYVIDEIECGGGYNGIWCKYASDIRFNKWNPVNAVNNLCIFGGNSIVGNCILDTCFGGSFLVLDNTDTINLNIQTVNGGEPCGAYPISIGTNSASGAMVSGIKLDILFFEAGTTTGVPAMFIDYCNNADIRVNVTNHQYDGTQNTYITTSLATFGSHNGSNINIHGPVDLPATTALYNGSTPIIGNLVWDGSVTGFSAPAGTYFPIYGSGAPTNGGSGTGVNKAGKGSLYSDYTNGNLYINQGTAASPSWVEFSTGAGGGVTSVTNSDGSLTISPTSGAVVASLNVNHSNTWGAAQIFSPSTISIIGGGNGQVLSTNGSGGLTWTNGYTLQQYFQQQTLTDASSISWNLNTQQAAVVTLGGNRTLANPNNLEAGGTYTLIVKQDATGSRTLAYSSFFKWPGGTPPVLSTAPNAVDILTFLSDGSSMFGSIQKAFA